MGTVGTVIAERLYVATLVEHHIEPAGLQPSVTLIVQAKFHELAQLTARHAEGTQGIGEGQNLSHVEHTDGAFGEARTDATKMACTDDDGAVGQRGGTAIGFGISATDDGPDNGLLVLVVAIVFQGLRCRGELHAERCPTLRFGMGE